MDVADIATREYVEASPDDRIGPVRSTLEDEPGVLVVEDGDVVGVVRARDLLRSQLDDDASVDTVVTAVPELSVNEGIRETARLLVEAETKLAPVIDDGGEIWGVVTADRLLEAIRENLDVLSVSDIHTTEVVTVPEDGTLGEAINRLREHSVSRLPIVERDGTLAGILTVDDIADFVVREGRESGKGDRSGDTERMLDLPVYDISTGPAETTTPDASVADAVDHMLDEDYDGLVVSPEYAERVAGVITKTDVLRALTYTEEDQLDVQVTNAALLETTTRDEIRERIEEVTGKHSEMDVLHAHVRFQRHEEEFRGTNLVRCQIRIRSDQEEVAGTGEGYGAEQALSLALEKLERNVLELKGRRSDEEYRGQLLRKLDEL
jgi:CBS domain-containing protein